MTDATVAIIGIGCHFPGARGPRELWQLIRSGGDGLRGELPIDRQDIRAADRHALNPQPIEPRWAGYLPGIDAFDAAFFGLSRREATHTDPQHRLLLQIAWEALEDAGLVRDQLRGSATGVFVGLIHNEYERLGHARANEDAHRTDREIDLYLAVGTSRSAAAGRLAHIFGFEGPSLVVDTDRSSSLVAVHLACQSLRRGECRQALVGAANLMLLPDLSAALSRAGMLSPDRTCWFGDARANGFVRSEGVGAVVLKRLSDARADGDRIYAVIRGSAVNSDANRSGDLMAPSVPAQVALISEALRDAGVDAAQVDYVEAHGTGTPVGDVVELSALGAVLGPGRPADRPCLVASVKTNIGHTEAAAGIAGLIKIALAMRHRQWPASLHFDVPNPRIPFDQLRLAIPRALTDWPSREAPAIAGVSAFGLTGTNAHVVLASAPTGEDLGQAPGADLREDLGRAPGAEPGEPRLLALSAADPTALRERVRDFVAWLPAADGGAEIDFADLCYTAGVRRSHLRHRVAVVASSREAAREQLLAYLDGEPRPGLAFTAPEPIAPRLAFVFSGQGSQWLGMGLGLAAREPVFRATLEACDAAMRPYRDWSLFDELRAPRDRSRLGRNDVVQPVIVAMQLALAALWESYGIVPDAVVGASLGEISAAHVAGILSLPEAMRITCERSRPFPGNAGLGRTALVTAPVEAVRRRLEPYGARVSISGINSREKILVAGEPDAVEALLQALVADGFVCQPINTPIAAHSALLDPVCPALYQSLEGLRGRRAHRPFYASVLGGPASGEALDARYWVRNLRDPVLFGPTTERLIADGYNVFVEVSPSPVLWDALLDSAQAVGKTVRALPSLRAHRDERGSMFESLAALFAAGAAVDWNRLAPRPARCVSFPPYPWTQERYWIPAPDAASTTGTLPSPSVSPSPSPSGSPSAPSAPSAGAPRGTLADRLAAASPREAHELLAELIATQVARARGEATVDRRRTFKDLGLTSLMLVEIRGALSEALGRAFHATLLFDHPSVEALAAFLATPATPAPTIAVAATAPRLDPQAPIAIVGVGLRFPGGAVDAKTYWDLLARGVDAITDIPADRWDARLHFAEDADAPGKMYSRWGGFLDGIDRFDHQLFGISRREAERMDPQQRLLLEVAWEALEHAGYAARELHGSATGVFIGMSNNDDYARLKREAHGDAIGAHDGTGDAVAIAAGRIAYVFGFHGPALAVDTACSSSLTAVHLACQSLRRGESTIALAGGVNIMLSPHHHIAYSKARMLSPSGRCKTFDAAADGYVRGEGCGVVVLRPLSDAVAAGDHVLAVIRGSAINQDGRSNGLTAPSGAAQQRLLRAAYAAAGVAPAQISYIEAHGTGTSLGDPIEVQALGAVLSEGRAPGDRFLLGSVKTNIGHLEPAAGVAGLIKVALSIQHGLIPQHLHLTQPNPYIRWDEIPGDIPRQATHWPAGKRLAGISSFGFSGTNVHVVVGEPPPPPPRPAPEVDRPLHVLALSAPTDAALDDLVARYDAYLGAHGAAAHEIGDDGRVAYVTRETANVADVCFTANGSRAHGAHRAVAVGRTLAELREQLAARPRPASDATHAPQAPGTRDTRVAFLFTGQGAQYVEMGKQLYQTLPSFRQTLDACAAVLDATLARPLLEVMFGDPGDGPSLLDETGFAQPALFALEIALAKLWQGLGVEPSVLLGHSVGEYAAACLAGTMSLEDGLRLIAERGRLMQSLPKLGTMMACAADEDRLARAIDPHRAVVSIAAVNAPGNTVISGETRAIEAIAAALAQQGIKSARLRTSHAFHSPMMEPILDAFERFARGVAFQAPRLPVISNVTGRPAADDQLCSAAYWARHLRAPVRFQDSVAHLAREGYRIFLEIGPRPTLLAMARQNVQAGPAGPAVEDPRWLPSLKKANEDWAPLLDSVAQLHLAGVDLDWGAFDHAYARRRVSLPAYAFQRTRCWFDDGARRPARVRPARRGAHPFLGERVTRTDHVVLFDGAIDLDRLPFLEDHRVHGIVVVPAVVMVEALLAAAVQLRRGTTITLRDVVIHQALALADDAAGRRVQTLLRALGDGRFAAELLSAIETDDEPTWTRHVTATVELSDQRPAAFVPDLDAPELRVAGPAVYERLAQRQIALGPSFRAVAEVRWRDQVAEVCLVAPPAERWPAGFVLPPAAMDAAFHAMIHQDAGSDVSVPVAMATVRYRPASPEAAQLARCWVRREDGARADFHYEDDRGEPVLEILGAGLRAVPRSALLRLAGAADDAGRPLWKMVWQPREPAPTGEIRGLWLVFVDAATRSVGAAFAERLEAAGAECRLIALDADAMSIADVLGPAIGELSSAEAGHGEGQGIVLLAGGGAGDDAAARAEAQCAGVLRLAQAVLRAPWRTQPPRVWLATTGAHAVAPGEAVTGVSAAGLWGLGRVLANEHASCYGGLVDLDPAGSAADNAAHLLDAVASDAPDRQRAYRAGVCHALGLVRDPDTLEPRTGFTVDPRGSYLITGGLGGLGREVAAWLAAQGAQHVVLMSRRAPDDATLEAQRALEAQGGVHVDLVRGDVADAATVARVLGELEASGRPLRGIFHAAGVLEDGAMTSQTVEALARVLAPKSRGAWNLHRATAGMRLDCFVLFSSVSAVLGNPGQASYAAANCFLDALAHHRRALGLAALSINWGPWARVGMASRSGGDRELARRWGLAAIEPADGVALLGQLLRSGAAQAVVMPLEAGGLTASALYPDAIHAPDAAAAPAAPSAALIETLAALPAAERGAVLFRLVFEVAVHVMGLDPSQPLPPYQPLNELGLDSLLAIDITTALGKRLGCRLPTDLLLNAPSVEDIVDHLQNDRFA